MSGIPDLLRTARAALPEDALLRWAAIFFSLAVPTFLVSLSVSQAFLSVAGVLYAIYLVAHRPHVAFPPIKLPLALFCLFTFLSVLGANNPGAGWLAVRKLVLFAIFLLALNLVATPQHLKFLFHALFVVATVAGLLSVWQFAAQYRAVSALHPGQIYFYMTLERITGFMGHWMNFGGQQMLVAVALVAFLLLAPKPGKVAWLLMAVIALSIVLNFTRSVWLGCLTAGIYLIARWKPRWLLAIPGALLIAFLVSPQLIRHRIDLAFHPSQDPALSIRLEMWRVGGEMVRAHPWLGVGPNNIVRDYDLYLPPGTPPERGYHNHMHNNFVQFAAERGLPCLAAWVWLMAALVWQMWMLRRRLAGSNLVWIADAGIAAWLAMLIEGCFEYNFGTSPVLMVFLFVASTPFIAAKLADKSEVKPVSAAA